MKSEIGAADIISYINKLSAKWQRCSSTIIDSEEWTQDTKPGTRPGHLQHAI